MTIEGKEVLLIVPDFAEAPKFSSARQKSVVELGEAPRIAAYTGQRAIKGWPARFVFRTRGTARDFESFFMRQAGRWGSFWCPSWHADLNPVANVANGATVISISPVKYATVYDPSHADTTRPGHYIFLLHIEGTLHVSKVLSVTGTSPEVLTLATAAPRAFNVGSFFIGFVHRVRFTTDKLRLEYSGPNAAKASIGFIEDIQATGSADVTAAALPDAGFTEMYYGGYLLGT